MGISWFLYCKETNTALSLGKLIGPIGEPPHENTFEFGGWNRHRDGERTTPEDLLAVITKFLVLHRGKPVILVPESFFDVLSEERQREIIDSPEWCVGDWLSVEANPPVDVQAETRALFERGELP